MMASRSQQSQPMPSREDFSKLAEEQKSQINEAFSVFDADKDGRLDYHEFRFALRALGFDLPKQETFNYFKNYGILPLSWDTSRECGPASRELTLPGFQGLAGALVANRDPVEECHRAFRLFDTDGRGMITVEDLRRVMHDIGQNIDEKELVSMIREFDADGKGGVNEDEFVKIMLRRRG